MGVEEEIFEELFKILEYDDEFPKKTLEELKRIRENGKMDSKDNILRSIKEGFSNEDQKR